MISLKWNLNQTNRLFQIYFSLCYIYYLVFREYSLWNTRDNTLPFWACFWAVNSEAARENCSTFNNDEDVIQGGNSATSIFQATNWILWKIGFGRHHHQKFLCSKFKLQNPPWLSHIFRIFDRANKCLLFNHFGIQSCINWNFIYGFIPVWNFFRRSKTNCLYEISRVDQAE